MEFEIFGRKFEFFTSERQYIKFYNYLHEYLIKPPVLFVLTIIILYLLFVYLLRRFEKQKFANKMKAGYPILYMGLIVSMYLLDRKPTTREFSFAFDNWLNGATQLHETMILSFMIDVMIFLVYGFILQKCWNSKLRNILIVVISALLIEEMQYILARGVGSVTDIVAFTVGGVIGIFIGRGKTNNNI